MLKIGLTGGIGSGKSTVSNVLKEKGFTIIDADIVSRDVLKIYPQILESVRSKFGTVFFDEKGELKRKEFGNYIFAGEERKRTYEEIIIPFIKKDITNRIEECEKLGKETCIVDAATLIENRIHENMDVNILVWIELDTQIERVKKRDNLTEEQVLDRIHSQMSLEDKKNFIEFIIDNTGTLEETKKQIDETLIEIGKKYRGVECLKV